MENKCSVVLLLLLCFVSAHAFGTQNGSESWGYVEVRPKAHMFWWLYQSPNRVENGSTPWPTVLWLQGGPGASGVGLGNFQEIGPLDVNLNPRNSTWLNKADLLFVDNPVGTGYSYVEDDSLFVKSDVDAANDLTTLLKNLYNNNETLQKSPLTIVAESYGGKFAVTAGVTIANAIKSGDLKLQFGGIALGDSWISPEDFVFSWGPLLLDVSRLDINGAKQSNSLAEQIKQQIANGQYETATNTWSELENAISSLSNSVDFYNFMLDSKMDPLATTSTTTSTTSGLSQALIMKKYSMYLNSKAGTDGDIDSLMNGAIKDKLKIIPKSVSWGGQSNSVFEKLAGDFMKPRIDEVDQLLSLGVNVTVYNGQVDLICATKGTEAWVQKLKWDGLKDFNNLKRTPVYCGNNNDGETKGFVKSYRNFHFYWILGAGHFVPVDQPCIALQMVAAITQSPAPTAAVTNAL
ncbi:LOW QUALITY PROTEIN: serine carboxypeptidase-like 51 [Dioscorea cayenensis subsp. rotundata]|uniref:Carboxypeptidase n=1 Tax=Dioscorea cayennensis subsp. rotundata TaxID=55577 RepID=A0AB40CTS7_DIOCR|nr:LOW QUALITY PROTEIN: serine carboxypeptidase-like 51 [Dioscorea cayenensis subsp. rotundata]